MGSLHGKGKAQGAENKPPNMYLLDWGKQMEPRSVGNDTISGDMSPHWGLPARLLFGQMATHAARMVFSLPKSDRS